VWQRAWNEPVVEAISRHGADFNRLAVLKAEVSWKDKQPELIRVPVDYPALAHCGRPVGLALRIGPYAGPFASTNQTGVYLIDLAASILAEAVSNRVHACELQIDFDCADSKLAGYRVWVQAIRRRVAPVPVVITALPSWLNQATFASLVAAADGYVLQVHSLEAPRNASAPFTLCDPAAARRAVERAGSFGIPFRVALPTYGYTVAFDKVGGFVGLSAEGSARNWPEGAQLREVRTDPVEMGQLIRGWTTNRPSLMQGVIWFRLPTSADTLNLRWPALASIMAGRSPRESLRVDQRRVEAKLVEISLANDGELDISSRLAIEVRWSPQSGTRLVAGDGLRGFELLDAGASSVKFQTQSQPCRLPAGEKQVIGWLRLSDEREVTVECKKL
jgi:hypothetical protein